uniref:Uncharacterized protein TCIL3000_10_11510 n=1 Tax=Trypanosoma congolense (strain IL3000) TaxID=1068625 RepID=G0UYA3_TRYCI|nr:unnamed protein product [Trypanosoma congolense IL3000]
MSYLSHQSFVECLRKVFPCSPRIFSRFGCTMLRRGNVVSGTSHGIVNVGVSGPSSVPSLPPLASRPFFCCPEEEEARVLEFARTKGLSSFNFVLLSETEYTGYDVKSFHDDAELITVQLDLFEQRLNLADFAGTRVLQEELQRTREELCCICERVSKEKRGSAGLVSQQSGHNYMALAAFPEQPLHAVHLVWEGDGWFFDVFFSSPPAASSQSFPDFNSQWCWWIVPFREPLSDIFLPRPEDVQQFCARKAVTLAGSNAARWPCRDGPDFVGSLFYSLSKNYWAATGQSVQFSSSASTEGMRHSLQRRFAGMEVCWFTLAELSRRGVRVRRDGVVYKLPVKFDSCGFFLHEAPLWFLISQEEVMQRFPILPETLRGEWCLRGCRYAVDTFGTEHNPEVLRRGVIYLLSEQNDWHVFQRQYATVNFGHTSTPSLDPCDIHKPLIFININVAVEWMCSWSKEQQERHLSMSGGDREVVNFFANVQPGLSAGAFVNAFLKCCGRAYASPQAASPLEVHAPGASPSDESLGPPGTAKMGQNEVTTFPSDGSETRDTSKPQVSIAEGLRRARQGRRGVQFMATRGSELPQVRAECVKRSPGSAVDVGILWLSFDYQVPAVNAFDTEPIM